MVTHERGRDSDLRPEKRLLTRILLRRLLAQLQGTGVGTVH
ncbi:hypothetical protein HDF15_004631 [Granulicella mallensis]|uniref:Uncharacterized protein n=1 Tax=Granulicella mallensis TaxID=940614 RepID=A0A7W7ZU86_9BACT|nr:hypothetical protein [Granulicella mallensis]